MSNYKTIDWLNLRSEPTKESIKITVLPPDTVVEKIGNGAITNWFKIRVHLNNTEFVGFAFSEFLEETSSQPDEAADTKLIDEAHLITTRTIERASVHGRAYPINEPGF